MNQVLIEQGDLLCKYLEQVFRAWFSWINLLCYRWIVYSWRRSTVTDGECKYHTSNDVFSWCKSVHKMATGKSDDGLIQRDNKMRIWTRSGKFRKVENPELSMAWWQSMTRTPMTTSMIAWHCTMRTPLTTSTDIHMSVSAHSLVLSCLCIICTRTVAQDVWDFSCHLHGHDHVSGSPRLDSPFLFLALLHVPYLLPPVSEVRGKPAHSAKREYGLHRRVLPSTLIILDVQSVYTPSQIQDW